VALVLADGTRSDASKATLGIAPATLAAAPGTDLGPAIDAEVQKRTVFYDGAQRAELSYVMTGATAAPVTVELVRVADGLVVARWDEGVVGPGIARTVTWTGMAGGKVQRDGSYSFRVTATPVGEVRAVTSQALPQEELGPPVPADDDPAAFTFLRHRFPIAGAHTYGEGAAAFGGGRGHQGHDVFAECGTPVVAARGGTVKFKQYHSAAGNYIVVDGARTGVDYAYMHLRDAALVDEGDRVRTGQLIGYVGDTGRASGCHLHFEMWGAPGWYSGGQPMNPLASLRAWDASS
jgi:hypothetical protein